MASINDLFLDDEDLKQASKAIHDHIKQDVTLELTKGLADAREKLLTDVGDQLTNHKVSTITQISKDLGEKFDKRLGDLSETLTKDVRGRVKSLVTKGLEDISTRLDAKVDQMIELVKALVESKQDIKVDVQVPKFDLPQPKVEITTPEPKVEVTLPETVVNVAAPELDLSPEILVQIPEQPTPVVNVQQPQKVTTRKEIEYDDLHRPKSIIEVME